jgi:6-phosphofructokinase
VTKVITSALFGKETTVCPFCALRNYNGTITKFFNIGSTKIFVLEVMGRHAGWIAAAGGLVDDSIPVVILFPEVDFPGKLKITRHKHFLLQVRSILDHSILTFNLAK